jgi:predicted DNA-binding transcriptional regulator AlpA
MSKSYPIQPDLFDREALEGEAYLPAVAAEINAKPSTTKKRVVSLASAEPAPPCASAAPVAMREPERPFLSDVAVAARYAVSRPTIWRWTKAQCGFPQPIKVSSGTTRWRLEDLQRYDLALLQQQDHTMATKRKGGAA